MTKYSHDLFGQKNGSKVSQIIDNLEIRLGNWVNAELLLMLIIGILSYIAYLILGLKYAVPLAIIAGLLEIVPSVGPIISTVFATLIAITISPTIALFTVVAGIIVHQLENNFITPKIMKETCDLSPVITILLLMVGARIGGVAGAVLAVPIYMTIEVTLKVLLNKDSQ
jgi:predicted PurR-regulated permease PerM